MFHFLVPSEDSYWKVCAEDESSPAVTLELWTEGSAEADLSIDVVPALELSSQALPAAARAGPSVENWLGKNVRRKLVSSGCYFVPKMPKGDNLSDIIKGMFFCKDLYILSVWKDSTGELIGFWTFCTM